MSRRFTEDENQYYLTRVKALMLEGLIRRVIAKRLGLSDAKVTRLMRIAKGAVNE